MLVLHGWPHLTCEIPFPADPAGLSQEGRIVAMGTATGISLPSVSEQAHVRSELMSSSLLALAL